MTLVPKITLSSGKLISQIGLGTWQAPKGVVKEAVKTALAVGYRHIDCAYAYLNQDEVGEALAETFAEGNIKREDVFITSKLWNTFHSKERVAENLAETLQSLKLSYLDLFLIHWPMGYQEGGDIFPKDESGKFLYSQVDYLESWKAMEEAVDKGLVKSIGLSNFNSQQVDKVCKAARIQPVMLQVECHPYHNQSKLISFCKERGIAVTAYSPLGAPANPWAKEGDPTPMKDETIVKIAEKYKKSSAQIILRFLLHRGVIVIPKSVSKDRIEANLNVCDFDLEDSDIEAISSLDRNGRIVHLEWIKDHPHYPFSIPF